MSEPDESRTEGRRLLRKYLKDRGMTVWAFCRDNKFNHVSIQRLVRGERGSEITATFAVRIAQATGGAVPVEAWTVPMQGDEPDIEDPDPEDGGIRHSDAPEAR